jgi:hypothetical protein
MYPDMVLNHILVIYVVQYHIVYPTAFLTADRKRKICAQVKYYIYNVVLTNE